MHLNFRYLLCMTIPHVGVANSSIGYMCKYFCRLLASKNLNNWQLALVVNEKVTSLYMFIYIHIYWEYTVHMFYVYCIYVYIVYAYICYQITMSWYNVGFWYFNCQSYSDLNRLEKALLILKYQIIIYMQFGCCCWTWCCPIRLPEIIFIENIRAIGLLDDLLLRYISQMSTPQAIDKHIFADV